MSTIRAKFRCTKVQRIQTCNPDGTYLQMSEEIELTAVYGGTNEAWSKWTPSGQLRMTINNPNTQGKITPEKCYYIDLIEAPEKDD